jgi:hypothetical protein
VDGSRSEELREVAHNLLYTLGAAAVLFSALSLLTLAAGHWLPWFGHHWSLYVLAGGFALRGAVDISRRKAERTSRQRAEQGEG